MPSRDHREDTRRKVNRGRQRRRGQEWHRQSGHGSARQFVLATITAIVMLVVAGCQRHTDVRETKRLSSTDTGEKRLLSNHPDLVLARTDTSSSSSPVDPALTVDLASVVRRDISQQLELVGSLVPVQKTTVVAELNGVVESIALSDRSGRCSNNGAAYEIPLAIDIGTRVKQGDVLVRLKDSKQRLDLQAAEASCQLLERQLADLLSWRREEEIAQLQATLAEKKAQAERSQADKTRIENLLSSNAASQANYDQVVAEAARTEAELKRAEAELKIALAGPTPEQIAVAKAQLAVAESEVAVRRDTLEKMTIRAPYDGVITKRFVDIGDRLIEMKDPDIVEMIDARLLFAEVSVPERYFAGVQLGDQARITVEGLSDSVEGVIDQIGGEIDPHTRTFLLRLTIDNSQDRLKPGGFARVHLPIASARNTLTVPYTSVSFDEGRPVVFVYQPDGISGLVRKQEVRLGISSRDRYEVLSGLDEGQHVAVGQTAVLSDGLPVRPRENNQDASRPDSHAGPTQHVPSQTEHESTALLTSTEGAREQ